MSFLQSRTGVSRAVLILALSGAMSLTLNFSGSFTAMAAVKGHTFKEKAKEVVGELKEKADGVKQDLKKRAVEGKARRQAKREAKKEAKEATSDGDEKGVRKVTFLYEKLKRGLSSKEVPCDVSEKSVQCEWEPFCKRLEDEKADMDRLVEIVNGLFNDSECHPIRHLTGKEILTYLRNHGEVREKNIRDLFSAMKKWSDIYQKEKVEKDTNHLAFEEKNKAWADEIRQGKLHGYVNNEGIPVLGFESKTERGQFDELMKRYENIEDSKVLIVNKLQADGAGRSALNSYLDFLYTEFNPEDKYNVKVLPGLYNKDNPSHVGLRLLMDAINFAGNFRGRLEKYPDYCNDSKDLDPFQFIGDYANVQMRIFDTLDKFSKIFPHCQGVHNPFLIQMKKRANQLRSVCEFK